MQQEREARGSGNARAGRRFAAGLALVLGLGIAAVTAGPARPAAAADDPSIQGERRAGIHAAMKRFVGAQTHDGSFLHYDPVDGKLLRLRLEALHEGIVSKGHFYVSCADFRAGDGTLYDLDFLVVPAGERGYHVQQAIVHKVGGEKRAYHVEQRWPGLF